MNINYKDVMTDFAVSMQKNRLLRERMEALGVREEDFNENFIRAPKKGGQKVNKTSSCVYLKHRPTGLEVKCMKERSQSTNRYVARKLLLDKIEEHSGGMTKRKAKGLKVQKQKARRAKRSAAKYHSENSMQDARE